MQLSALSARAQALWETRYLRPALIGVAGALAAVWFAQRLDPIHPVKYWLFLRLAQIWGWDLLLSASFVSAGHLLVRRVRSLADATALETLTLSVASGAVVFAMGMYAGGYLGLYGPVFAVALPTLMLVSGLLEGVPALRAWNAKRRERPPQSALALVAMVFGVLCVGILYLGILSPDAVNYDASWVHLPIAQDYARAGRIVAFPGDWVRGVPHLASIFNTWAFLVPGLSLPPLRWMMALHNEFTFFLWTLVGVAGAIEWLTERAPARGTWAAFFLFPAIFVYDSNMGAAADHFLAFFVPPLFIAAVRAFERFDVRASGLLGMLAAAALLTKFHAFYLLLPLALAAGVRLLVLVFRHVARRPNTPSLALLVRAVLVGVGTFLLFVSPHFLKNWIFYQNPLYPLAQGYFSKSGAEIVDSAIQFEYLFADWRWRPPADLATRFRTAAEMVFSFSFTPHYSFARDLPIYGSLFTLAPVFLPFLPRARRLWFGVLLGSLALFVWASTFWVDRNLQTFAPLLVAVTGAILVRAWGMGWLARLGVAGLVSVQLAWGGELYFSGSDRITSALSLLKSGMDGRAEQRFRQYRRNYVDLGASLPRDAKVLLHTQHIMLGIDRHVILDWMGFQGLIDYRTFKTPRDVYERFRELGVTHVVYVPGSHRAYTKQEEILFDTFAKFYGEGQRNVGGLVVFPMPTTPPPVEDPPEVLSLGVPWYVDGIFSIQHFSVCEALPPNLLTPPKPRVPLGAPKSISDLMRSVNIVLHSSSITLDPEARAELLKFTLVSTHQSLSIYARPPIRSPSNDG